MAEPTIAEVFGTGATQDIGGVIVVKSGLASRGLTALAANTAESLLVAIVLQSASNLTETNRLSDLVNRNVTLSYVGQDLIDQGGGNVFLRDTYQVSLYKVTTVTPIDPDNY